MSQPYSGKREYIAACVVVFLTAAWCIAAARALYCRGDSMVGFHPMILFRHIFAALLALVAISALLLRKYRVTLCAALCIAALYAFFAQAYKIEAWAWKRSILKYDKANQLAIAEAGEIVKLTDMDVPEGIAVESALTKLNAFRWYCRQTVTAPSGNFRAFRYRGVVHIRIQKSGHGYRGVALVLADEDLRELENSQWIEYESLVGKHWVIWRCD